MAVGRSPAAPAARRLSHVIPEIPRLALVRSIVLSIREEPYVEAAITVGTPTVLLLIRHVLPNTVAPLIVQGTFICASAILIEAILSFLGVGIPTETPTWGNIMAEGRSLFRIYPHNIFYPGFLAVTILQSHVGDGLRDALTRFAKRCEAWRSSMLRIDNLASLPTGLTARAVAMFRASIPARAWSGRESGSGK